MKGGLDKPTKMMDWVKHSLPLSTHSQDSERRHVVSMLAVSSRKSMSRSVARAISQRTTAITQHMSSSSTSDLEVLLCQWLG